MKLNKNIVLETLVKHQNNIKDLGVKRIGLFGSFLRIEETERSDLDILVEFETGKKSFRNFIKLLDFLEEVCGREVDLITVDLLSPYIGPHIIEEVEYAAIGS